MARSKQVYGKPETAGEAIARVYAKADKLNKEGFPSFNRTLEEDTLSVLLANTLSNTFYVSEKKLADETLEVLTKMADGDPEFLAKALVYARSEGLMKLAPVVGLAILSAREDGKKVNFRKVFQHVVKTPDDLREFVALCRTKKVRKGLGGEARDAVKRWLQHISEYHAVKYGSSASKDITLRDIIRMAHPRPVNESQNELFGWLVNGWETVGSKPSPTNPQVWALEKIKRSDDEKEIVSLIDEYRLTWEVVVPSVKKMTKPIWRALLKDMPYMALLRNLNTMERHGVFDNKETVKFVVDKISDPKNVKKSKQFPFRFYNAFNAFEGKQEVRDALTDALEVSFENLEKLPGRVAISNDVSGSMGCPVSDRGKTRYCDIAGLFAASIFKKSEDVILLPADDHVHNVKVSKRSTIMDIASKIGYASGGTNLGAPVSWLIKNKHVVDTYIGITDNEDWAAGYWGRGFLTEWQDYKAKVNPNAKAILITISPYRDFVAPTSEKDVHFIIGWSDAVLRYIPLIMSENKGQVEGVRKIDLTKLNAKA